jgi:hypothetical protein
VTDCDHCEETVDDDAAYLRHMDAEHPDEMGRIERRRLEELGGSGGGTPTAAIVGVLAVLALLVAVVFYTLTVGSGGSGDELGELGPAPQPPGYEGLQAVNQDEVYQPYQIGAAHEHGSITVEVEGETMDFRQPEFQHPQSMRAFHFEAGESRWHVHANGVTLEYALEATAFGVTNTSFAYDGVIYRRGGDTSAPDGWEVVTDATVVYRVNEPYARSNT